MTVKFEKYQGTGNDFIMVDNRKKVMNKNQTKLIAHLCDRKFGIGADGLILLQEKKSYDFEMVYFNSDGRQSSMCGNGGRCLIQFAHHLKLIKNKCHFLAIDGDHEGQILAGGKISLKMNDVAAIEWVADDYVLNTGSPHYVVFVKDVQKINVVEEARKIRYNKRFAKAGINVNFVQKKADGSIAVRTYERGVEDETLSCGTGVVASSLAFASMQADKLKQVNVQTPGGNLHVKFKPTQNGFEEVYLIGPAKRVFGGKIKL